MLNIDDFRDMLRKSIVDVVFVKVNGDERRMRATLQEEYIEKYERKTDRGTSEPIEGVVTVWDCDIDEWRRIRFNSIISWKQEECDDVSPSL